MKKVIKKILKIVFVFIMALAFYNLGIEISYVIYPPAVMRDIEQFELLAFLLFPLGAFLSGISIRLILKHVKYCLLLSPLSTLALFASWYAFAVPLPGEILYIALHLLASMAGYYCTKGISIFLSEDNKV